MRPDYSIRGGRTTRKGLPPPPLPPPPPPPPPPLPPQHPPPPPPPPPPFKVFATLKTGDLAHILPDAADFAPEGVEPPLWRSAPRRTSLLLRHKIRFAPCPKPL